MFDWPKPLKESSRDAGNEFDRPDRATICCNGGGLEPSSKQLACTIGGKQVFLYDVSDGRLSSVGRYKYRAIAYLDDPKMLTDCGHDCF